MLLDKDGNLWTCGPGHVNWHGGPGVVVHWDLAKGNHTVYTPEDGLPNAFVRSITQTGDGVTWIGTWGGGIASFDGENWKIFTTHEGLPSNYIAQVITRSDGNLWINTDSSDPSKAWAFGHFVDGQWIKASGGGFDSVIAATDGSFWASQFETEVGHFVDDKWDTLGLSEVTALGMAPDGEVWAARGDSIYKYNGHTWKKVSVPWSGQNGPVVSTIAFEKDGIAWFGFSYGISIYLDNCGDRMINQEETGIYRFDGKNWEHITTKDGLADNKICTIVPGPDGSMWVGTFDKGVSRFDGKTWTTYQVNDFMK